MNRRHPATSAAVLRRQLAPCSHPLWVVDITGFATGYDGAMPKKHPRKR